MENSEKIYCRFCAEPKMSDKLLNFMKDDAKCEELLLKLAFLNAIYVDISKNSNILPKTVCFVCYDALNKAYEFLNGVKRAQDVLIQLFKSDQSSENIIEDLLTSDSVKEEIETQKDLEVKREPEEPDVGIAEDSASQDSHDYEEALNVQDILDAAITYDPAYPSDVTLYAKEITDIDIKSVSCWKKYPWICGHCNIEFLDLVTLRSHTKITHGKCNAFMCIDCQNYGKSDFNSFIKHVKKHRRKLRKRCHYCDATVEEDILEIHIQQHFQKSQIPCGLCGEILKNEEALQKHLLEYNSTKPKRKPRRKRGTPLTIEELTCDLCHKVYKNPNSLRDHRKIHTKDRKKDYTCDRCGKMFYNKGTLTSHIMSHDKIRPHICRICNRSFLFPNMLRRHVEMHSGVKPFSCEQCGRCFRLQYQMNAHKIIHTDAMPHVCRYCNKAFRFKQILKNHERQHTGDKPYGCQYCSMEFTNWSNYNKHMKRRHGTDTSKKKITPDGVFPVNPQTGEILQHQDPGTEEWKTKIMVPGKRGKKKVIKKES